MVRISDFFNKEIWINYIKEIKKNTKVINKDEDFFIDKIIEILNHYFNTFQDDFTILFSGGIDSTLLSLIAKRSNKKFEALNVSFANAQDIIYARKIASFLGLNYREKIITQQDILSILPIISSHFKDENFVVKELAVFEYIALSNSKQTVIAGTGSEELFGGYERHAKAKDVNKECWNGLLNIFWNRDIKRVKMLSVILSKELYFPFLTKSMITLAMSIPNNLKIKDDFKKYILAKTLLKLGLPKELAFRKKKAAQYGSGLDKFFIKLSKKLKLKSKSEIFEYF